MTIDKIYYTYDNIDVTYYYPKQLLQAINEAFTKYGEDNVSFVVETECKSYSDYEYAIAYLQCKRNMSDAEKSAEKARLDTLQRQQEAWNREQYERLKKQFEGK